MLKDKSNTAFVNKLSIGDSIVNLPTLDFLQFNIILLVGSLIPFGWFGLSACIAGEIGDLKL